MGIYEWIKSLFSSDKVEENKVEEVKEVKEEVKEVKEVKEGEKEVEEGENTNVDEEVVNVEKGENVTGGKRRKTRK